MSDSPDKYEKEIEEALSKLSFEEIWALNTGKKRSTIIHSTEAYEWLIEHIDQYENDILAKADDALNVLLLAFDVAMPKGTQFFLEQLTHKNEGHRKRAALALRNIDSRNTRKAVWYIRQSHDLETREETETFREMLDEIFDWESRSQR